MNETSGSVTPARCLTPDETRRLVLTAINVAALDTDATDGRQLRSELAELNGALLIYLTDINALWPDSSSLFLAQIIMSGLYADLCNTWSLAILSYGLMEGGIYRLMMVFRQKLMLAGF